MALSAFTLRSPVSLAMIGGVLFLISDILLMWQMRYPPGYYDDGRLISDLGWFTYYFGQLGLCLGGLALRHRT